MRKKLTFIKIAQKAKFLTTKEAIENGLPNGVRMKVVLRMVVATLITRHLMLKANPKDN